VHAAEWWGDFVSCVRKITYFSISFFQWIVLQSVKHLTKQKDTLTFQLHTFSKCKRG